jgi:hypothetical protein
MIRGGSLRNWAPTLKSADCKWTHTHATTFVSCIRRHYPPHTVLTITTTHHHCLHHTPTRRYVSALGAPIITSGNNLLVGDKIVAVNNAPLAGAAVDAMQILAEAMQHSAVTLAVQHAPHELALLEAGPSPGYRKVSACVCLRVSGLQSVRAVRVIVLEEDGRGCAEATCSR